MVQGIEVAIVDAVTRGRLSALSDMGDWRFESAAATRIADLCCALADELPCPLCVFCVPPMAASDEIVTEDLRGGAECSAVLATACEVAAGEPRC